MLLIAFFGFFYLPLFGQTTNLAPGAPGMDAHWLSAAKNGFGTANSRSSRVWFTLTRGVMTEAFYPTLDTPNVQLLQLLVVKEGTVETEIDDMNHRLNVTDPRSLTFEQVNTSRTGQYSITKTYVTDPSSDTILINIQSRTHIARDVYVYFDPSLGNSGLHDTGWFAEDALLANDGGITTALVSDCGFENVSNGYLGTSDGLTELKNKHELNNYDRAADGNIVQVARLKTLSDKTVANCTLALGFGSDVQRALKQARGSLHKGFALARREYEQAWHRYVRSLPRVEKNYQAQLNMSAMVLTALEDKTYPGAMIASPSNPWGAGPNANEATTTGYHAVWSRDLYHVATAFIALGDINPAERALDYLFGVQQKLDGSFPQNSRVDGRAIGGAQQLDQVAYPLILAYQLNRNDRETWLRHIKPAADFIVRHGPATEQERWEEERGYSPSTIAAEIAGLVCAAEIARQNDDADSAFGYLKMADEWASKVDSWTATTNGPFGHYFLRVTENSNPNDGGVININSGGGDHDEREIVDAGFLELVRLGIKSANDPLVRRSMQVIDRLIRVETKNGSAWYRYNWDAYGERGDGSGYDGRSGKGRPWPLLTGERGEYELAFGNTAAARSRVTAMMAFANEGRMIPEQIWDKENIAPSELYFGVGTGSATPLAWSMAQFIRLVMNVKHRRNLETPRAVVSRFQNLQH